MNTPEPRTILSLALLLAGAVLSSFIVSGTGSDEKQPSRPELSMAYYLDQAELIGTGPDGKVLYQVWTQRAFQPVGDSDIELVKVRMLYGPPMELPWELKSNTGRILADSSVIELRGDVVAISATKDTSPTIIRTQRLDIDPSTRQASTNSKVEIEFDERIVNATGMHANFETNEIKLLSNVNGKFIP